LLRDTNMSEIVSIAEAAGALKASLMTLSAVGQQV
jgi:hypothetical protein